MSEYADCLQLLTGSNPEADLAFQGSQIRPCDGCHAGAVNHDGPGLHGCTRPRRADGREHAGPCAGVETYVVSIDGVTFERLCFGCFLATNAGDREQVPA